MDLTVQEKMGGASACARELAAEKHFYDAAQPFFPLGFSVTYRNPGHWDISARQCPGKATAWRHAYPQWSTTALDGERERAFRIRGKPDAVHVFDERWDPHRPHPRETLTFRSVMGAMLWIVEELMRGPVEPDPQIESLRQQNEALQEALHRVAQRPQVSSS